jgi:hypothetical protein
MLSLDSFQIIQKVTHISLKNFNLKKKETENLKKKVADFKISSK